MVMILKLMETTRKIEAYLDGTLEIEEHYKLEILAKNDKEISDLITLHREVNDSIRDADLHTLRDKVHKIVSEKQILPYKQILRIVAVILLLIGLGIIIRICLLPYQPSSMLFEEYYVRYEPDVVNRSSEIRINDLNEAILNYESRNYTSCDHLLDSIIFKEKDNYLALFYKGVTCLELQLPFDAINAFSNIPNCWNSPYAVHRDWYLALALIEVRRENDAIFLLRKLMDNNNFYSKKSYSILHKIRK
jgi:hypothetical protein